mmetsp:Transcript_17560/g.40647  ORF Transcript_17560/g.40647 Transcript_17560/m.40647 type:complete len:404 (-) Transcript_17560:121-1332(-)
MACTTEQQEAGSHPRSEEAESLVRDGYVVVRAALSASSCDLLREYSQAAGDEAKRIGRLELLGNIQEAELRADLKLDLSLPVRKALNEVIGRCRGCFSEVMGARAKLVELATITSDPGAVAQPVHADTMHGVTRFLQSDVQFPETFNAEDSEGEDGQDDMGEIVRAVATETAIICTALVALQDVSPCMGPTHVWPGTHTVGHHATLWGTSVGGKLSVAAADEAFGVDRVDMTLEKGDMVVYDSRTMHCGGANTSQSRRSVLCISLMGSGIRPDGTTWTMLRSLQNKLRLSDFPIAEEDSEAAAAWTEDGVPVLPPPTADSRMQAAAQEGSTVAEGEGDLKPVPPLDQWDAAVQCSLCRRWRPCAADQAPVLTSTEQGFVCKAVGFHCRQEQGYPTTEIDAHLS